MFVFEYSGQWADFVVAQMATAHGTRRTDSWGYGCIVVGREFEGVIERNWDAVHRILGPYLHVFALVPPPMGFVGDKISKLRREPPSPDRNMAIALYENLITKRYPNKSIRVKEKVNLLMDLKDAGLEANQYADFLFFDFRNNGKEIMIDVIAAKSAAIPATSDDREYLICIEKMAEVAKRHYKLKSPVSVLVKDMTFSWDIRISILKAQNLFSYIKGFLTRITKIE